MNSEQEQEFHRLIDASVRILLRIAHETGNPSEFLKEIAKCFWKMAKIEESEND